MSTGDTITEFKKNISRLSSMHGLPYGLDMFVSQVLKDLQVIEDEDEDPLVQAYLDMAE